ncbi:MAG: biotin synthase BioB [Tepidisphaeraceae bacterium]
MHDDVRHDWTHSQIREIYDMPLMELVFRAAETHRRHQDASEVQVCKLVSVKTGGCPEDCKYCSQSVRYSTEVDATPLMNVDEVVETAKRAKANGVTRVCLGAAWRQVKDNAQFDQVLDMVRDVTDLGVEVCCTLGMLTPEQAGRLEDAGLHAYNHNVDTSNEYYDKIITTRTYEDRLKTLANVRKTNVTVCTGGIIGMGETVDDRVSMLHTLGTMTPHPESVPINVLSKVPGTPLADAQDVSVFDTVRMIATARIVMPKSVVRLSAGRAKMTESDQALCFMAGANSIFSSEQKIMLTKAVPSQSYDEDKALLNKLGLTMRPPFKDGRRTPEAQPPSDPTVKPPCYITGTGLVTVQGVGVDANWQNLLAGRVLLEKGVVALPSDSQISRVSQLAIAAAGEAISSSKCTPLDDGRTGLVVGTSKGPIEDWIDQLNGHRPASIANGVAQVAVDLGRAFGHRNGPRLTLAGACASGLLAMIRGVELIRQGACDRVLVVAAEASTHALFEANFRRLGVLATSDDGCRPFDVRRRGFFLAEAAAAVMLDRNPNGNSNSLSVHSTASFADAYHLTGPDPSAAALSHALLKLADDQPVDLVHAHGTGTIQNDPGEVLAIATAFPNRPAIYSHKHAIGHTQGAAGLIAIVLNVRCHQSQTVPGNTATTQPMPEAIEQLSATPKTLAVGQSIAVAAGFGGSIACVRLSDKTKA